MTNSNDASGWWAKALGSTAPAQQPALPALPPTTTQPPRDWTQPAAPVHPAQAPADGRDGHITKENISSALTNAANYQNVKRNSVIHGETGTCPSCGSGNYFANVRGAAGQAAKPHCFECGFPTRQGPN